MLSRILVPLDGSPTRAQILPRLRQWFGGTGTVVHLLVVRPPVRDVLRLEDRLVYLDELVQQERASWLDYLVRQGSQLAYDGVVVRREVRFGELLTEILAVAERRSMHLIALIGRRHSWPRRWLRLDLAEQLLATSPIPTLVVPPACRRVGSLVLRYDGISV
jgi:nucleotide-binding universal stress UspA family protein